jgi:predicted RNA binding protein YcfA (HicA-like mRNA interferase family)
MKLPRNLSGNDLAKSLTKFGYEITRQKSSHMRLTTQRNGEHHITIPAHDSLRVGTLGGILEKVATHLGMTRPQLQAELFE